MTRYLPTIISMPQHAPSVFLRPVPRPIALGWLARLLLALKR